MAEKASTPRVIHTMLRVRDIDSSVRFYSDCLGMKVLRTSPYPEAGFSITIMGYDREADGAVIELMHQSSGEVSGLGFGHLAIAVEDAASVCDPAEEAGGRLVRQAHPLEHNGVIVGYVADPDGNMIEIVQADEQWLSRIG